MGNIDTITSKDFNFKIFEGVALKKKRCCQIIPTTPELSYVYYY